MWEQATGTMSVRMQLYRGIKPDRAPLTQRERSVLECVLKGMSAEQIAEQLQLTARIVDRLIVRIHDKLGAASPGHLVIQTGAAGKPGRSRKR